MPRVEMPAATITAIVAQLPSTNLELTSRFYRQKLGCREVGRYPNLLTVKWEEQEYSTLLKIYILDF